MSALLGSSLSLPQLASTAVLSEMYVTPHSLIPLQPDNSTEMIPFDLISTSEWNK